MLSQKEYQQNKTKLFLKSMDEKHKGLIDVVDVLRLLGQDYVEIESGKPLPEYFNILQEPTK